MAAALGAALTGGPLVRQWVGDPEQPPGPAARTTAGATAGPSAAPRSTAGPTSLARLASTRNPKGRPTRVLVESASGRTVVDARLEATYLDAEGVLAPDPGTAGWYAEDGWPKPGWRGASILVGHVNQGAKPDVFADLPTVRAGDSVTVVYDSRQAVRFTVTRSRAEDKRSVPADDSIWDHGNPEPVLRLITCDPQTPITGGHYEGNWVVWADDLAD